MYARSIRVSRFAAIVTLATLPFLMTGTAEAYQCKIVKTFAQAIGPAQAATIANAKTIWATKVHEQA